MEQNISATLEGLTLANLNDKLQNMRDQLRKNVDQDMEYVLFKQGEPEKETSKLTSRLSSYKTQSQFFDQLKQNPFVSIQPSPFTPPIPSSGLHPEVPSAKILESTDRKINAEELKKINRRKLTTGQLAQYVRYVLHEDVWEKIKEIWENIQDVEEKVRVVELVQKINKLSVKFSEAVAFQVPKINRNIPLKKVLFDLQYKTQRFEGNATWDQFQTLIRSYVHLEQPEVDRILQREKNNQTLSRNHFNIPAQILNQLKSVFRKSTKDHFLTFCSSQALLTKLESSELLTQNGFICVRPKGKYQLQYTIKDVIKYFRRKAPEYVDLDELLLFFSGRDFTCYPIEERHKVTEDSTLTDDSKHRIKRVKSDRVVSKPKVKEGYRFDEYFLSSNMVGSIRNKRLKMMIENEEEKASKELRPNFKAKPVPSTISQQKYKQFLEGIQMKRREAYEQLKKRRESQEKLLQKLKNKTRLFNSPKHHSPTDHSSRLESYRMTTKPVPDIVKTPRLDQIQNQKIKRRHRIHSETKNKYCKSWQELGSIAQVHTPCLKEKPESLHFKIPIKQIPNYRSEQEKVQYQLQCRRQQFEPTRIQEFYFRTDERHPRHTKETSIPLIQSQEYYDYRKILYSPQPMIYYTKKFVDQVTANKKKAYQREKSESKDQKDQIERKKKHKSFAKFIKNNLASLTNTNKIHEIEAKNKIERHKKYWKNLDREHEHKLNQIYTKILKRPLLYELNTARSTSKEMKSIQSPTEKKQKGRLNPSKHERKAIRPQYHDLNRSF